MLRHPQPRNRLHIPAVDELLDSLQYGADDHAGRREDESSPLCASSAAEVVVASPCPGTFLEVTGPSCSGKTHLLYMITAQGVLPRQVGGRQGAVVVLDTDERFDVTRLYQIMAHQVKEGLRRPDTYEAGNVNDHAEIETMIQEALRQVHIFQPQSLASLVATAEALPRYLFQTPSSTASAGASMERDATADEFPRHDSSDRVLHAVLLDSASAFYWEDRLEQDMYLVGEGSSIFTLRTSSSPGKSKKPITATSMVLSSLCSLQRTFPSAVVVVTTWDLSSSLPTSGPSFSSFLFRQISSPAPAFFHIQLTRREQRVLVCPVDATDPDREVDPVIGSGGLQTDDDGGAAHLCSDQLQNDSTVEAAGENAIGASPEQDQGDSVNAESPSGSREELNVRTAKIDVRVRFLSNQTPREDEGQQVVTPPWASMKDREDEEEYVGKEALLGRNAAATPGVSAGDASSGSAHPAQISTNAGNENASCVDTAVVGHDHLRDVKRKATRLVIGAAKDNGGDPDDEHGDGDGDQESGEEEDEEEDQEAGMVFSFFSHAS